jgi:putative cell wall-binding protein
MKSLVGLLFLSATIVLSATASFAQDSKTTVMVPPLVATTADSSPQMIEDNKMVCRAPRAPIGTRFPGPKICKTQHQWDTEMHDEQHNIAKSQIRGCLSSGVCPR